MGTWTRTGRALGRAAAAAGLVGLLAGCGGGGTPPPRVMQPDDFKRLAGEWYGTAYVQQEVAVPIRGVIYENGAFYTVPRTSQEAQTPGQMRIVDGGVVYESATSVGKMTFHETTSEWIWKWQGTTKRGNRAVTTELTRSK